MTAPIRPAVERERPRLSARTLDLLPAEVGRPTYERGSLVPSIVHIGVGGFHRAHQAVAIDRLLSAGETDWSICGVGLLEGDRRMKRVLDEQDGLYSLLVKHPDGRREVGVIGSIVEYLFAPDETERVIERMAAPTTRIVSLTITEGGYGVDRVTGEFRLDEPAVAADLAPGAVPTTVFGIVTEALRRRRERGIPAFVVQSCDNVQGNGDVARLAFTAFAKAKHAELSEWIAEQVSFPNSMVDRITPVTSLDDIEEVARLTGLVDEWPVVCEPFFQWVVEDRFPHGRPPIERVGAQLVADVEPYELMKLRLLNASHQGLCYFGYLAGHRFAHEAMADDAIATFLLRYMVEEASPTLHPVPGIDLDLYRRTLIERFSNPEIRDTLARLCAESSDRIPKWLLPVVREQLANGGPVALSAAIVASWARYAEGVDESGAPIDVVDPLRDELVPIARAQREHPTAFIANRALFGDLLDEPRFVDAYLAALASLHDRGAAETVRRLAHAEPLA